MAGTGADDQVASVTCEVCPGKLMVRCRKRNIPEGRCKLQPQWFQKAGQAVTYVLSGCRLYTSVDEQAVKVFAASFVVSHFYFCGDTGRGKVGPEGDLHVQEGIKLSPLHLPAQLCVTPAPGFFIEDDELNTRQITDELRLDLADYPGDPDARELFLKAQHHRDNMGDIANS